MCLYLILKMQVVLLGRKYPMLMGRSLEQNENGLHTNKKGRKMLLNDEIHLAAAFINLIWHLLFFFFSFVNMIFQLQFLLNLTHNVAARLLLTYLSNTFKNE